MGPAETEARSATGALFVDSVHRRSGTPPSGGRLQSTRFNSAFDKCSSFGHGLEDARMEGASERLVANAVGPETGRATAYPLAITDGRPVRARCRS